VNARTIGADQLFDIFDQAGQALAVSVDAAGAALKVEGLMERLDWSGDIVIRSRRAGAMPVGADRLWLVADGLDQPGPVTVHVRGPFGPFGLTLEQALRRIDHFHLDDQYRLRSAVERYFGVGPGQVDHTRHTNVTAAPARRTTKRTEKESQS
jgi:hypothetical protein